MPHIWVAAAKSRIDCLWEESNRLPLECPAVTQRRPWVRFTTIPTRSTSLGGVSVIH